ncbi:MAG: hypothetical protein AAB675_02955 [Patescibacteria group bacterium]
MNRVEVEHYPFRMKEDPRIVGREIFSQINTLFENPMFSDTKRDLSYNLFFHFQNASNMFCEESEMRERGYPNANLFYHDRDHSVFQATYDALAITQAVLTENNHLASHLTPEGIFSIPLGSIYHDTGFVYGANLDESFAGRNSIHVEKSIKAAEEAIDQIGIPRCLNLDKVKKLVTIGIQGTHFPYDAERREEGRKLLGQLSQEDRKEAQIVRLAVQFADLGGQTARVDQNPEGLRRLRDEMNACTPNMGTKIIGKDEREIEEKRKQFLEFVVEKTVGKTGNAFFGTSDHSFAREWHKTPTASR